MIVVKKKMKKPLIIVILAAILVVFTVAAILLNTLLLADNPVEEPKQEIPVVDTEWGESIYNKYWAVAYPRTDGTHISKIMISADRRYGFVRTDLDGDPETEDPFVMSYQDADGEIYPYLPPIMEADGNFEYDDVYAKEQGDDFGTIMKLTYLLNAFGTLYFDSKMTLPDNESERAKELSAFGFGEEDSPIVVNLTYSVHDDENDKENEHKNEKELEYFVKVGSKLPTNSGYYFMVGTMNKDGKVDYRPFIYTTYNKYLDYAFISFTDFINPILIAEGLPIDNAFEPYLTTDYQQYRNTVYAYDDEKGIYHVIPALDTTDGINVIVNADVISPNAEKVSKDSILIKGGAYVSEDSTITFDLGSNITVADQKRIIKSFVGKSTGKQPTFSFTLPVYSNTVDEKTNVKYSYSIKSVDAILTDAEDITAAGEIVPDGARIKVTYSLKKDGKAASEKDMVGILDLSSSLVPNEVKNALKGSAVGSLATAVNFERIYTEANSVKTTVTMVIDKIKSIKENTDEGKALEKVVDGAKVSISCYYLIDGVKIAEYPDIEIVIGDKENSSKELDAALMGKATGEYPDNYAIKVDTHHTYAEIIGSFTTYEIDEVKHFVVKEKIVSFAFQQASDRDPYYGESFYLNTTGKTAKGDYSLYGLNASACEAVVRLLGGLVTNASSSTGLVGAKTVDVVITPEKLMKYGYSENKLYENVIYFELPRGITVKEYKSDKTSMEDYLTSLDDYEYVATLGFTLYISAADPATGTRYIASDLYDVIAEISAEHFEFLERNFIDFYARRNLVLTDITNIGKIDLEFMMDDLKGEYSNKLNHNWVYAYNGKLYNKNKLTEEQLQSAVKYDAIDVIVTPSGECIETELSKYLDKKNTSFVSFRELYGAENHDELDSLGTSNFKEFIQALYFTQYEGFIDAEAQEDALENGKLLMRMSITMNDKNTGIAQGFSYVYEFYRVSDRRVVVHLYKQIPGNDTQIAEVSDFYVSIFSFKKLVNLYFGLLNTDNINNELPYPEDSILN